MSALGKSMQIGGWTWVVVAGAAIVWGAGATWYEDGFRRMLQLFSPFNEMNFFAGILILAPGLLLLHYGERFSAKKP